MDWTGGYVADIGYTAHFYRETAPSHMAFAALSIGRSPGRSLRPKRVLEIGFGQGLGLCILAAANPDVTFEGIDFNPEHVAHARRLIAAAELGNITVAESSFEEAAARGGADDVDVIVMHGIFSWVSRPAQDAIISIIRQRLQPDGVLYVSYNAMPGWAPLAPIRQLMLEIKRRNVGGSQRQLALALDAITELKNGAAAYFATNPIAARHVEQMLALDRVYLAHEYLDEHWELLHFSQLAARMGEAKLTFVASATLAENLDQYALPGPLQPIVAQTEDPIMRETLRDYAANKRFRRDLFARGHASLRPAEHKQLLSELSYALCVPPHRVVFTFPGPLSELTGKPDLYRPIVDRLAKGPATTDELAALPAFEGRIGRVLDCLCLLVQSEQVAPVINVEGLDPEPARRFNRLIVELARKGQVYTALACPSIRSGLPIRDLGLLALAALFDGEGDDPRRAAEHALTGMKALGHRPLKEGKLLQDDGEALNLLTSTFKPVLEHDVPMLRQLGGV
jgi:SAM-dependent methyltransferase